MSQTTSSDERRQSMESQASSFSVRVVDVQATSSPGYKRKFQKMAGKLNKIRFASVIPLLPPLPSSPSADSRPILIVVEVESIAVTSDPATPGIALRSDPFDSLPILPITDSPPASVDSSYFVCGSLPLHRPTRRNARSEPDLARTTSRTSYPRSTHLSVFGITDPLHLVEITDEITIPKAHPQVVRGQWSMIPPAATFHAMVNDWQWDLESVEERKGASTERWVGEVRRYSVDPSHVKGIDDPFPSTVTIDWPLLGPPILCDVQETTEGYWQHDHVEVPIPKLPSPPDSPGSLYTVPSIPSAEDVRTSLLFSNNFPSYSEDGPYGSPDTSAYASPPQLINDLPPLPIDSSCPTLPGTRRKSKTIDLPSPAPYAEGPPHVVGVLDSKPTSYFCPRSMWVPPTQEFKSGFYDSEDSSSADEGESESDEADEKSEGGLDVWTV